MSPPSSSGSGATVFGIGFAVTAYFVFSLQDATIKWLVADFPPAQVLFMRSAVVVPLCIAFSGPGVAWRAIASPVRLALLWRSVILVAAWLCFYSAARELQLAELTTIYFSSPLLVTVLAIPVLRERVTAARWASLALGFTGVIVACRPGKLHLVGPMALALVAAALWAYTTILIRQVVHAVSTAVLMFVSSATILIACGAIMPWQWRPPSGRDWALMVLVGVFSGAGQFMVTEAIRRAPASVVAPISFSALLWAFCLGTAIWGDVPDPAVFIGAGMILASGLLVTLAEWRRHRRRPVPLRPDPA